MRYKVSTNFYSNDFWIYLEIVKKLKPRLFEHPVYCKHTSKLKLAAFQDLNNLIRSALGEILQNDQFAN